jgi:hypothetical protein
MEHCIHFIIFMTQSLRISYHESRHGWWKVPGITTEYYLNPIIWLGGFYSYVKAKSCLCVMVRLLYYRRTSFFWDMTLYHWTLISWQFEEKLCLSSGVQNAANCSVLSDWFKITFCNRKCNVRTPVNSQLSFFSSVLPNPLVVVFCFMPYIRCTKFGHSVGFLKWIVLIKPIKWKKR